MQTLVIDKFINDKEYLNNFFYNILNGNFKLSFTNFGNDESIIDSFTSREDETNFFLPYISELYKKIKTIHDENFQNTNSYVYRWHLNVHPTGYDGVIHTDSQADGLPTYLYFVTPNWSPDFGGEFIIYNENKEAKEVISFVEDRLVIFNGYKPHRGVAPTRLSSLLRITIAFQTKLKNVN